MKKAQNSQTDDIEKRFEEEANLLFGQVYAYNYELLKKSEDDSLEGKYNFIEIFDFYITSHALSLIKNMYYGYRESPGMLQNVRCILEGLSMKRMFQAGDISEEKVNLLQVQEFLIEYRYYSRFTDILNLILIPEKLRKDYDDACVLFRSKLETKYNDKEIKNILRSNIPFLCNPAISHRFLIQKYLGSEYAMVYGLCSQIIHPSENNSYKNSECSHFVMLAYVLILNEYSHLPMTKTSLKSHTLMSMSSAIARELYQIIGDETKILEGIAEVFSQFFEDNYVSNTLRTISLLGQEMMFDRLTGFSEQVKVKWKLMMELFSVFHYEYVIQGLCEERYHLLIEHQNIQTSRNCNQHYDLAHAYEIYKRLYPHGCEMTTFEKAFIQLTGYTIEESGNVVTLTHMVDQFIHRFSLGEEKSIFEQGMKIDYVESQMISHANGYMWFANSGAWMDTYNIFQASDASLLFMLNEIQMVFEVHRTTEETTKFKSIINALRNGQKRIIDLMKRKLSLMQIPGIKI